MMKIEFYVERYNQNKKRIEPFNIFAHSKFSKDITKLNGQNLPCEEYKEEVRKNLQYYFWAKREYERSVGDAFETDVNKFQKIDVYAQCLPNLDLIATLCRDVICND